MPQSDDNARKTPQKSAIVTNAAKIQLFDSTTLQMLNRWIPDKERGHFFTEQAFVESLDSWKGTPLVFAQEHPDLPLFASDPTKALSMVKTMKGEPGRIVGNLVDPTILKEGHPRMMGALPISDPEVKKLWDDGKLSLSTAFLCDVEDRKIMGGIEPNHILLFEENDLNQPADKGALVNKEAVVGEDMAEGNAENASPPANPLLEAFKAFETRMVALFKKDAPEIPDVKTQEKPAAPEGAASANQDKDNSMDAKLEAELKNKVELANKEATDAKAALAQKDDVIKAQETTITELKNKVATIEKAEKDAAFDSFLKQIKPALYNKEEDKTNLRKQFDENPAKLLTNIANMVPDTSKETGEQGSIGGARDAKPGEGKTTVGCMNPVTGKYE